MKWHPGPENAADPLTRFSNFKWLAMRALSATVARAAPAAHGRLLDVGCGDRRFAPYLTPHVSRYVGLDYPTTFRGQRDRVDVFGSGLELPFASGTFDTVACFEVLEHVPDPPRLVQELSRVVRPGGTVILTVPFLWGEHLQPHDFSRYTIYGVRELFRRAQLDVRDQHRVGGFWTFIGQRFCYHLADVFRGPRVKWMLTSLSFIVLVCASLLEHLDPSTAEYTMSLVVASKPDERDLARAAAA